jgi:hypothetical protein
MAATKTPTKAARPKKKKTRTSPRKDDSDTSLGAYLGTVTDNLGKWLSDFDPGEMSSDELSGEILKFFTMLREQIMRGGEYAYVVRRSALFICECMSLRLRHGRSEHDVPVEHAAILDAAYSKIQSTKSGAVGDVDVDRLTAAVDSDFKSFATHALREMGLSARIPNSAHREKKILVT